MLELPGLCYVRRRVRKSRLFPCRILCRALSWQTEKPVNKWHQNEFEPPLKGVFWKKEWSLEGGLPAGEDVGGVSRSLQVADSVTEQTNEEQPVNVPCRCSPATTVLALSSFSVYLFSLQRFDFHNRRRAIVWTMCSDILLWLFSHCHIFCTWYRQAVLACQWSLCASSHEGKGDSHLLSKWSVLQNLTSCTATPQ